MSPTVTNPLTPGVYRIDLPCELAPLFGNWRRAQKGKVHVIELENGPEGKARVSFVVFGRPGAFPFGRLGHPVRGSVVGATMPDWPDVVAFIFRPLGPTEEALSVKRWADFFLSHAAPEFAELQAAVAVARANVAIIRAQLEQVKAGTSRSPAAAVSNAASLAQQSIELLLAKAGRIPLSFPRALVNESIATLTALVDEIKAAPGKALHAITEFAGDAFNKVALPFVIPAELGLVGVGLLLLGGYLAFQEKKTTPTTRNLMLAGGAVALLGGGTVASNIKDLLLKEFPP